MLNYFRSKEYSLINPILVGSLMYFFIVCVFFYSYTSNEISVFSINQLSDKGTNITEGVYILQNADTYRYVKVPNLMGMSYSDALQTLSEVGLNINPVYDCRKGDSSIYEQFPKPGENVKKGWPIDIFIHGYPPQ